MSDERITIYEALDEGCLKVRLPFWNEFAYLVPGPVWCSVYDINAGIGRGQPISVLTVECNKHGAEWERGPV